MQFIWRHIETIIQTYSGSLPLRHFLKEYFSRLPQLGKRDRTILTEMAYAWFRFHRGFPEEMNFQEKILNCLLSVKNRASQVSLFLEKESQRHGILPGTHHFQAKKIISDIPLVLSENLDRTEWLTSLLHQPDIFIRIRQPEKEIFEKLSRRGIPFRQYSNRILALPPETPISQILPKNTFVVQDWASQQTGTFFSPKPGENWLDCCAGAGGKAMLLQELEPKISLTVADIRPSVLANLKKRFRLHGLDLPEIIQMDAEDVDDQTSGWKLFDRIIVDAPCTGSGTWSRSPEQLYFFHPEQIHFYTEKQKKIAGNMVRFLKPEGKMIYITCSVFRQENEEIVTFLTRNYPLIIREQKLINGIARRADCLFVAVLDLKTDKTQ